MKKRWLSLLMVCAMLVTCLPVGFASVSAEDSTPQLVDGVYQLANETDLFWFANTVSKQRDLKVMLTQDITLTENWPTNVSPYNQGFRGVLDGNGHKIIGLTIDNTGDSPVDRAGMFLQLEGGTIKNLTLENVNIKSEKQRVGGLVGEVLWGTISNCTVSGSIETSQSGNANMGGIAGLVTAGWQAEKVAVIENCVNNASITATATDESDKNVAGIVGKMGDERTTDASVIRNCVNTGTITGVEAKSKKIAGIAGESYSSIVNCVNTGTITGYKDVAGIVGVSYNRCLLDETGGNVLNGTSKQYTRMAYVANCYNTGNVVASASVNEQGGLVSRVNMGSSLVNSYSTVSAGATSQNNKLQNVFYLDTATKGKQGTKKTLAEMQSAAFVQTLNNFVIEKKDDEELGALKMSKWAKGANGYPVLTGEPAGADDVVDESAWIETVAQLLALNNQTGSYKLANDITVTSSDVSQSTAVFLVGSFKGTFDGQGYTIKLETGVNKVLFGNLNETARVKNLNITGTIDLSDNQTSTMIAPFAQTCKGSIDACSFDGTVKGKQYVGGIAAGLVLGGSITNCSTSSGSEVIATNDDNVFLGGIVARMAEGASVRGCVNNATLSATGAKNKDYTGGIVAQATSLSAGGTSVIDGCTNNGKIDAGNTTGGIIGAVESDKVVEFSVVISNCQNLAAITGKNYTGGIAGRVQKMNAQAVHFYTLNCSNHSAITATGTKGGVVGTIRNKNVTGYVYNCYTVDQKVVVEQGADHVLYMSNGYTTANDNTAGAVKKSLDEMKSADFVSSLNDSKASFGDQQEAVSAVLSANNITLSTWKQGTDGLPMLGVVVKFYGKSNILLATKNAYSIGELREVLNTTKAPALGGYSFESWGDDTQDVESLWETNLSNDTAMSLTAVYVTSPTEKKYTVTVENATAVAGDDTPVTADTPLSFDQRVIVSADSDQTVAYWELDGAKVGFNSNTYTFYVSGQNTIKAVFEGAGSYTPEVVLQQATYAVDSEGQSTLSVIAQTSIPSGYTVKSYGAYYTGSATVMKALAENADAVDASKYVQVVSSKTKAGEQYMTHLLNVGVGKTRYARAYAVVENAAGEQQILWSTAVYQFKTAADGVTITKGAIE